MQNFVSNTGFTKQKKILKNLLYSYDIIYNLLQDPCTCDMIQGNDFSLHINIYL